MSHAISVLEELAKPRRRTGRKATGAAVMDRTMSAEVFFEDSRWRFELYTGNSTVIGQGRPEGYKVKIGAVRAVEYLRQGIPNVRINVVDERRKRA